MITSIQDIDQIEFLEDHFGIKLLTYQKEILRKMLSTDKIYICPWQSYKKIDIRVIHEMAKCCLLINNEE